MSRVPVLSSRRAMRHINRALHISSYLVVVCRSQEQQIQGRETGTEAAAAGDKSNHNNVWYFI
eukprot:scaffold2510_cov169-Amphora_coffeaeformis.AAC.10